MSLDLDFDMIWQTTDDFLGAFWPVVALAAGVAFAVYLAKLIIQVFKGGLM